MKYKISKILIIIGIGIVFGSLSLKLYSQSKESKAVKKIEQKIVNKESIKEIKLGDEVGVIEIPSIDLKTAIVHGTEKKYLRYYVCQFEYSAMPGEYGNFSLAGHSSYVYNQVFNEIHKIKIGDNIKINTVNGEYKYIITEIFETDPSNIEVLNHNMDKKEMTIVTCTNGGKDRLIVKAEIM